MKKFIRVILILLFSTIFIFSLRQIYKAQRQYHTSSNFYSTMKQYAVFIDTPQQDTASPNLPDDESVSADDTVWPTVDFESLRETNPDVIGWIYIEGTEINYPVVQGADNSFYLSHLYDGTYNSAGCIFMDVKCASDFSGKNSVLHGHHMKNGSMFAGLVDYKKQGFYEKHTTAFLITPQERYKIQFFSGYVASEASRSWDISFTDDSFDIWLSELAELSCFKSEIAPTIEDRVVTLSTCSYEFQDARFVLHGVLENCGQTTTEAAEDGTLGR